MTQHSALSLPVRGTALALALARPHAGAAAAPPRAPAPRSRPSHRTHLTASHLGSVPNSEQGAHDGPQTRAKLRPRTRVDGFRSGLPPLASRSQGRPWRPRGPGLGEAAPAPTHGTPRGAGARTRAGAGGGGSAMRPLGAEPGRGARLSGGRGAQGPHAGSDRGPAPNGPGRRGRGARARAQGMAGAGGEGRGRALTASCACSTSPPRPPAGPRRSGR